MIISASETTLRVIYISGRLVFIEERLLWIIFCSLIADELCLAIPF
jgi:hypothetical protein